MCGGTHICINSTTLAQTQICCLYIGKMAHNPSIHFNSSALWKDKAEVGRGSLRGRGRLAAWLPMETTYGRGTCCAGGMGWRLFLSWPMNSMFEGAWMCWISSESLKKIKPTTCWCRVILLVSLSSNIHSYSILGYCCSSVSTWIWLVVVSQQQNPQAGLLSW